MESVDLKDTLTYNCKKGGGIMSKDNRFEIMHVESTMKSGTFTIVKDTVTGVHYLRTVSGYGGGLTPLLDENGKVVIEK